MLACSIALFCTLALSGPDTETFGLWSTHKEVVDLKDGGRMHVNQGAHLFQVDNTNNSIVYSGPDHVTYRLKVQSIGTSSNKTIWVMEDKYIDKIVFNETPGSEYHSVDLFFKRGRTYFHFDKVKKTY